MDRNLYSIKEIKDNEVCMNEIEANIQLAFLNMLHEQGVLEDNVYSTAARTIKGRG